MLRLDYSSLFTFTLQVWSNVGVSVDPAVQLGVWLELVEADDGLGVEVVFHSNEQKAQNYEKGCGLKRMEKYFNDKDLF